MFDFCPSHAPAPPAGEEWRRRGGTASSSALLHTGITGPMAALGLGLVPSVEIYVLYLNFLFTLVQHSAPCLYNFWPKMSPPRMNISVLELQVTSICSWRVFWLWVQIRCLCKPRVCVQPVVILHPATSHFIQQTARPSCGV